MKDNYRTVTETQVSRRATTTTSSSLLQRLREHVSNSSQFFGVFTLIVTSAILLFLTGLTVIGAIMGLILFSPLIIVTSPIWVPFFTLLFLVTVTFFSMCGFGVVVVAGLTWMYRYFRGLHPPGSERLEHARNRIYDCGGYLQKKMMDAAPGA
ncbi:oleosin 1-like [Abrus precatorius]|uniref:Oleosin 1-like n=1 Tax=Abrus precatorius TaxID=3816 RepID=A0A8B8MI05_ABRPR|nr:oleosin 1-like [Abrus precatorius]